MTGHEPLGKRVLIRLTPIEEKTKSGLYIPQADQKHTNTGNVIMKGSEVEINVGVGDKVMFNQYQNTPIEIDDIKHVIVLENDVFLKMPE